MNTEDNQSVAEVRAKYFSDNGIAEDGDYGARWVPLKFGPITLALYNSASRKRAAPIHDLHHLVTGYDTDPRGEAEVATWELAAGTHDKWFAFFINLPALLYGAVLWPRAIWTAWRKGCRETGLYTSDFNSQWLHLNLDQLRRVALSPKPPPQCIGCKFSGYLVTAVITTLTPLILAVWIVRSLFF